MKVLIVLLVLALGATGCSSTKYGCPAVNHAGENAKTTSVTLQ